MSLWRLGFGAALMVLVCGCGSAAVEDESGQTEGANTVVFTRETLRATFEERLKDRELRAAVPITFSKSNERTTTIWFAPDVVFNLPSPIVEAEGKEYRSASCTLVRTGPELGPGALSVTVPKEYAYRITGVSFGNTHLPLREAARFIASGAITFDLEVQNTASNAGATPDTRADFVPVCQLQRSLAQVENMPLRQRVAQ